MKHEALRWLPAAIGAAWVLTTCHAAHAQDVSKITSVTIAFPKDVAVVGLP